MMIKKKIHSVQIQIPQNYHSFANSVRISCFHENLAMAFTFSLVTVTYENFSHIKLNIEIRPINYLPLI